MAATQERKATIIGISGCSSSGKTTLSRLLRDIFPHTAILHEDDFYKAEKESVSPSLPFPPPSHPPCPISTHPYLNLTSTPFRPPNSLPLSPSGHLDWDSAASLDLPALVAALDHIHAHGALPPTLVSKEDQNPTPPTPVSACTIARLRGVVGDWLASPLRHPRITRTHPLILLDGFLLYAPPVTCLLPRLDMRLFLTASHDDVVRRREGRGGYVTAEGWWADPAGYVEEVMWGNYVRDHGFMFVGGDVGAGVDEVVCAGLGVRAAPGGVGIEGVLEWAVGVVMEGVGG